ncbi:MAG: hypothetical protein NTV79_07185 [Candidatus Aureabacteria bacterium]|nr:hypothetical protein [Candidatus Auribacterota bacterium]
MKEREKEEEKKRPPESEIGLPERSEPAAIEKYDEGEEDQGGADLGEEEEAEGHSPRSRPEPFLHPQVAREGEHPGEKKELSEHFRGGETRLPDFGDVQGKEKDGEEGRPLTPELPPGEVDRQKREQSENGGEEKHSPQAAEVIERGQPHRVEVIELRNDRGVARFQ